MTQRELPWGESSDQPTQSEPPTVEQAYETSRHDESQQAESEPHIGLVDRLQQKTWDIAVGTATIVGAVAFLHLAVSRQQSDFNSSLSGEAARSVKGFDTLKSGFIPYVEESQPDDPETMRISLLGGKICELRYVTDKTRKWYPMNDRAHLIKDPKTGKVDTGTCPPAVLRSQG